MAEKYKEHTVTRDEAELRLDRWFKRHFPHITHGQLQKLLRTGQVRVGGKRAEASVRLEGGQSVRVPPQVIAPPKESAPSHTKNDARVKSFVIFEDDDVIVLNKPPGLAVQGGTGLRENLDDMLIGLARKGDGKPKLVHRLDRDTGGVLLLARNAFAAARLTAAFRHRDTEKTYWGVTLGVPKPEAGKISAPLLKRGEIMIVDENDDENARTANTLYRIEEKAKDQAAFVVLWPITGRTHQLRVHMAYIGTPLLGDRVYGNDAPTPLPLDELGQGLHLHARRLIIPHPRRGVIEATAPLAKEMRKTWKWFGFDPSAETPPLVD